MTMRPDPAYPPHDACTDCSGVLGVAPPASWTGVVATCLRCGGQFEAVDGGSAAYPEALSDDELVRRRAEHDRTAPN